MNTQDHQRQQRRVRERALHRRRKELGIRLQLLGELLCDSHKNAAHWHELVEEGITALLGVQRPTLVDDKVRASLAQHFKDSASRDPVLNAVSYEGNMLKLDGHFDIKELAKRMIWIGVKEQFREVGDDSEEQQSRWGFDPSFELAVCLLADSFKTDEQPGVHADGRVDDLIMKARALKHREEVALEEGINADD